eukprot:gnl/TRDRNA2_/TRDRNA2_175776_c0_seq1.p1 gnl/TRDRNA2_/TRDRNA2_175776_c0~~gnl/TRDRNA2_/TRDRNA2_175776_c0_seq1.p1  ORF type:complete len:447 (+),score=-37.16 gnl/TRDRNA2_/TRDRNA2_175776_c0_seq1:88-1428(+)
MGACLSTCFVERRKKVSRTDHTETPEFGLSEDYVPISFLGDGSTCETWLMHEKNMERMVAVKAIKRPIPLPIVEMLKREVEIHSNLGEGHLNIINLYEVILTKSHLTMVQEYAQGGCLLNFISERYSSNKDSPSVRTLSEDEALFFFRQFISAVEFCHKHGVTHRDLKLDNTLLDSSYPPLIKICDFGFAKMLDVDGDASTKTIIGTPVYMAPDILACTITNDRSYDGILADIWSSGIMLFVMLIGDFPFDDVEDLDLNCQASYKKVLKQQTMSKWSDCIGKPNVKYLISRLSPSCRDLLDRILVVDANKRIRMEQLKKHPWFIRKLPDIFELKLKKLKEDQLQLNQIFKTKEFNERTNEIKDLIDEAGLKYSDLTSHSDNEKKYQRRKSPFINKKIKLRTGIDTFTLDRTYDEHTSKRVEEICSKINWEQIYSSKTNTIKLKQGL